MPIQDWRQLQNALNERQTGIVNPDEPWLEGWDPTSENATDDYKKRLSNYINSTATRQGYDQAVTARQRAAIDNPQDYTEEAIELGFGDSRKDQNAPYDVWRENPANTRAVMQTQAAKLVNGALKAVPYAGTTWADNTVGLILGLQNVLWDAIDGDGEFTPYASFVDTPFARAMQGVRDISDKILPNYRTQEELDDADRWWRHINGNFIGDVFLKNLGFTIGAGASAKTASKALMRLRGKDVRQAYKAALAASGGEAEAVETFRKVASQAGNSKKIGESFAEARRVYHNLGLQNQIVGGFGGAIGEARVEALSAAKEHYDENQRAAQEAFEVSHQALMDDVEDNYTVDVPVYDGFGNKIGTQPGISQAGYDYYNTKLAELQQKYTDALESIDAEARDVANNVFGLNIPLLAGSNMIMFGRMLSGGFKTQAKTKLRGKPGNYRGAGNMATAWAGNVGRAAAEGVEELSQKIFSEGAKDAAAAGISAFHNDKYDKDAMHGVSQWMLSMLESAGDVISDPKSWEEFTVGLLTGSLAQIPHKGWQSSINQVRANQRAAKELNDRMADPQFRSLWEGMVRHNHYEDVKNAALEMLGIDEEGKPRNNNAEFVWHTVDYKQVFNDVKMFADSGRLDDLEDVVDSVANLSVDDVIKLGNSIIDEADKDFDKKSPEQKLEWLKERAKVVKDAIRQYRTFREDAIDALHTSDDDVLDEYALTKAQMQEFENRYRTLADEILPTVDYTDKSKIENVFGNRVTEGRYNPKYISEAEQEETWKALDGLHNYVKDPVLKQKVEDMGLILDTRQQLYQKLINPNFEKEFNDTKVDPEEVADQEETDMRKKAVAEHLTNLKRATTLKDYLTTYEDIMKAEKDADVISSVNEEIENDPDLKKFLDVLRVADDFEQGLSQSIEDKLSTATDPDIRTALSDIQDAFANMDSEAVLKNMPEDAEPDIELAKALLNILSSAPRDVQAMARTLFVERLNDRAQANGLGELPVIDTGSGSGTGTGSGTGEGGGTGTGGGISQVEHVRGLISAITDLNNTDLNKFASGDFSDYPDLTEKEQIELMALAKEKIDAIKIKLGIEVTDDDGGQNLNPEERGIADNDPRRENARRELVRLEGQSLKGTPFSIYNIGELKQGRLKKYFSNNAGANATVSWMIQHKVQQFTDTGALARLNEWYSQAHDGAKLPIYFVANPHYLSDNLENNPFVVPNTKKDEKNPTAPSVLLAVEMDDQARAALSPFYGDAFSDDTLIDIEGKKYQVIGEVWNPTPKEIKAKEERHAGDGEIYQAVKKEAQKVYDHTITNSIRPQYNAEYDKTGNAGFTKEGKWYVAKLHPEVDIQQTDTHEADWTTGERLYTTLNYINTGRNITREAGHTEYQKIPVKQSLKDYLKYGGKIAWTIHTANGNSVQSVGAPEFPPTIDAVPGSLWMSTSEANGHQSWTHITVATANEFDFEANKDTAIVQRMDRAINTILADIPAAPTPAERKADFERRKDACRELSSIFYTGKGNMIQFDYNLGNPFITVGTAICPTREEFIATVQAQKLRFEVDTAALDNTVAMNQLIDAGILRSELRDFIRRGASFGVNFLVDTDENNNPVAPYPAKSEHSIAPRDVYVSSSQEGSVSNVVIGEAGYRYNSDGTVTRMGGGFKTGEEITDPDTVAVVKALAMAMVNTKALPGRKWIIDVPGMYQELYEVPVDGKMVHLKRVGKNSKLKPEFDDMEWDGLMHAYGLREITGGSNYISQDSTPVDQLMEKRDEVLAAEDGGTPQPPVPPRRGRRTSAVGRRSSRPDKPTVTQSAQQKEEEEEKNNCGGDMEEATGE